MSHTNPGPREMRTLLRRYPDFMDMRAALVGALWNEGIEGEAESNWWVARTLLGFGAGHEACRYR